jgi:MFS family permease
VLSAYAIIFAAVLVPAGRVADRYGRKKILLIGVGVFTGASALASFAPVLGVLVVARAIQAVGAAMIVPTSLGLLYPNFPKRQDRDVPGAGADGHIRRPLPGRPHRQRARAGRLSARLVGPGGPGLVAAVSLLLLRRDPG